MKKISLMLVVAFMAVMFFSCNKKTDDAMKPEQASVNVIAGTFNVQDGDITLKSADLTKVTRTWSMYSNNSTFYTPGYWSLVDGREFITGSAAYNFWHNTANNPVTFSATQAVMSNLTPDENLRLVTETKNSSQVVAYLGMLDFKPSAVNFPLTLHGFRLGDELSINANAITTLPGGQNLVITVNFGLAPIDIAATKAGPVTGTGTGVPNGNEFTWADIIYGASVFQTVTVGAGDVELYSGLDKKVMGTITITITETGNGGSVITKTVQAAGPGQGLKLTLTTNKIGWYDSGTITFTDTDITVNAVIVQVN